MINNWEKDGCTFCKIVSKELPSDIVYEDEDIIAFLDKNPVFPGHTLVIPKEHYKTLLDIPDPILAKLFSDIKFISRAVMKATGSEGIVILNNTIVSQSIPHAHVHLIPRNYKDGFYKYLPRQRYHYKEGEQPIEIKIREEIEKLKI